MKEPVVPVESCDEAIPRVSELIDLMEESGDLHARLTKNGIFSPLLLTCY